MCNVLSKTPLYKAQLSNKLDASPGLDKKVKLCYPNYVEKLIMI